MESVKFDLAIHIYLSCFCGDLELEKHLSDNQSAKLRGLHNPISPRFEL